MADDRPSADGVDCCDPVTASIGVAFDRRTRGRTPVGTPPPLHAVSRRLFDVMSVSAAAHPAVLEIGSGTGAMLVALLEAGAASGTGYDLSAESVRIARIRAADAGLEERATFNVGDGAIAVLPQRDWLVLDRVMCCYPRLDELLANALSAAGDRIGFSVPVSYGWRGRLTRMMVRAANLWVGLRGHGCRGFVHDIHHIEGTLVDAGFRPTAASRHRLWHIAVFDRSAAV